MKYALCMHMMKRQEIDKSMQKYKQLDMVWDSGLFSALKTLHHLPSDKLHSELLKTKSHQLCPCINSQRTHYSYCFPPLLLVFDLDLLHLLLRFHSLTRLEKEVDPHDTRKPKAPNCAEALPSKLETSGAALIPQLLPSVTKTDPDSSMTTSGLGLTSLANKAQCSHPQKQSPAELPRTHKSLHSWKNVTTLAPNTDSSFSILRECSVASGF